MAVAASAAMTQPVSRSGRPDPCRSSSGQLTVSNSCGQVTYQQQGNPNRLRGEGRQDTSELLGWRAPLQGQGEPFVVVRSLPCPKGGGRLVEVCKPMASPKLLLVDPMAALHLPVLLGPPRPNVAMPDAGRFDRKDEIERKLSAVVALQLADPEGERPLELDQERQAGALMKPWVEAQDPKASAVVQGRVPERPASRNLHELNVHLDAFAGLRLLEELHLPGDPLSRPPKTRDAEIAKNALDRAHGDADVVNAAKPELGSGGAVGELRAWPINSMTRGVTRRPRRRGYHGTSPSRRPWRHRSAAHQSRGGRSPADTSHGGDAIDSPGERV